MTLFAMRFISALHDELLALGLSYEQIANAIKKAIDKASFK